MVCEEQLVKSAIAGDENSFCQIVESYKAYVFAIILGFIKDKYEAENVAQEVFLQIHRSLPQYRYQNLKGWIGRITVNKAIDWKRTEKAKRVREQILFEATGNSTESPEEVLLKKTEHELVQKICSSLPEIYRSTLEKFYLEGKSQQQIAVEEGITIKTVESRLYRARGMVREKWREAE